MYDEVTSNTYVDYKANAKESINFNLCVMSLSILTGQIFKDQHFDRLNLRIVVVTRRFPNFGQGKIK